MREERDRNQERTERAENIVKLYSVGSLFPGVFPIPWLDLVLLSGVQLKMLRELAGVYQDVTFSKELGKSTIASLVGGGASVSLALIAGQLLRPVPGIGQLAGLATMTTFGAASTYAVGKVFIQHLESGGTLLTFDPEKVRTYYRDTLKKASVTHSSAGVQP